MGTAVVHLLAKASANLKAQDEEGNTAPHEAYEVAIAGALIQEGANVVFVIGKHAGILLAPLGVESLSIFEAAREDHPKDSADNVSGVSHSARLDRRYRPDVK